MVSGKYRAFVCGTKSFLNNSCKLILTRVITILNQTAVYYKFVTIVITYMFFPYKLCGLYKKYQFSYKM